MKGAGNKTKNVGKRMTSVGNKTKNRGKDKQDLIDILLKYDISISTQLGDKNAQNMGKILKM